MSQNFSVNQCTDVIPYFATFGMAGSRTGELKKMSLLFGVLQIAHTVSRYTNR
jgi:hypothetical protein